MAVSKGATEPIGAATGGAKRKRIRMAPKLAYRNLFHDRLSLFVTLVGIVFSVVLLAFQSGIYLGIPEPFANFVDAVSDPSIDYGSRWGDIYFAWLVKLHFGRWRSAPLKALWAIVGLVPAVMFVTGAVMWWQRWVRPALRRRG